VKHVGRKPKRDDLFDLNRSSQLTFVSTESVLDLIAHDPESHFLLPPADEHELAKCEATIGWKLPVVPAQSTSPS
jgi:hypothetical protein